MSTSLSSITDFFNFFNLPISILDNNFSIIYKRCYEEKEQQLDNDRSRSAASCRGVPAAVSERE